MDHDGERGQKNARRVKRDLNAEPTGILMRAPLPRKQGPPSPARLILVYKDRPMRQSGVFWKCIRAVRTVRWL